MTAIGQVMLKTGASRAAGKATRDLYLNPFTLGGYAILLIVTLINLYAFRVVPLKAQVFLVALTLLMVTGFSFSLLRESMTRRELMGALVILSGIAIYGL